ncbi:nucleotidyltransferase domain-containing protein [Phyllobacterium endophyticum]|uniref:nucleotidyltransferase domain-containing protein n=1 Tax=Phyllobacterium endophyticum TaxID=1149773 RepID=UPI003CCE94CA
MVNSRETVALVLDVLASCGIRCDVFGGWAEEFLGLRHPGPHKDIDLVYRADCFAAVDAAISALMLQEVMQALQAQAGVYL